jgi:hypothetical protein
MDEMSVENRILARIPGSWRYHIFYFTIQYNCSIVCVPVTRGTYQTMRRCTCTPRRMSIHPSKLLPLSDWTRTGPGLVLSFAPTAHAYTARCFDLLLISQTLKRNTWTLFVIHKVYARQARWNRTQRVEASHFTFEGIPVDMMTIWLIATLGRWAQPAFTRSHVPPVDLIFIDI